MSEDPETVVYYPGTRTPLTPQDVADMMTSGMSYRDIRRAVGWNAVTVKTLKMMRAEHARQMALAGAARVRAVMTPPRVVRQYIRTEDPKDPEAMAQYRRVRTFIEVRWDDHDPNRTVLGDPEPGRSALDARRRADAADSL